MNVVYLPFIIMVYIFNTINFLSGDTKNVIIDLQKKMDFYSNKKDYERAAIYRDKVQSIRDTQKKQNVLTGFDDLDIIVIKRNKFNCCLSVLRIEDSWITSSQNFFPDSKENVSDQELLSAFLESFVIDNKDRKTINLLFQGEISKETKDFLANLLSPKIIIHKIDKQNKNLIDICSSQAEDALSRNNNFFQPSLQKSILTQKIFYSLVNFCIYLLIEDHQSCIVDSFQSQDLLQFSSSLQRTLPCFHICLDGPQ